MMRENTNGIFSFGLRSVDEDEKLKSCSVLHRVSLSLTRCTLSALTLEDLREVERGPRGEKEAGVLKPSTARVILKTETEILHKVLPVPNSVCVTLGVENKNRIV